MKRLIFLPLLFLCSTLLAADVQLARMNPYVAGAMASAAVAACTGSSPSDCTWRETFDGATNCGGNNGSGYNNCNNSFTWLTGVPTTTTGKLQGTYSLAQGTTSNTNDDIAAQDEYYATALISIADNTINGAVNIQLRDSGGNALCLIKNWQQNLYVTSLGGSSSANISTTLSNATPYYVKIRAKKGTGANGECQGWSSTNGTSWGTPQSANDGTWTAQISNVYVESYAGAGLIVDDIRVYTGDISY